MSNLNDVITYGTAKFKVVRNLTSENINDFYMAIPLGSIIPYSVNSLTLPKGFLLCDGSAVSRSTYDDLFAAIGTTYGIGDGETTFNLPNLNSGKFLEGASTAGTSKDAGLPNITGYIDNSSRTNDGATGAFYKSRSGSSSSWQGSSCGNDVWTINLNAARCSSIYGNSTTVQPSSLTIRYIIKAYNIFENDPIFDDIYDELDEKFDYRTDFTIIYPNGGTEQNPANVTISTRYVESNPFSGYTVYCQPEIYFENQWGVARFEAYYNPTKYASGIYCYQHNDSDIIMVTGNTLLVDTTSSNQTSVRPNTWPSGETATSTAPCRIKVWKVGKIANNT